MSAQESASFFERLKKGMEESIAYSRGELSLAALAVVAAGVDPLKLHRAAIAWGAANMSVLELKIEITPF